jgi:uncharacterized protein
MAQHALDLELAGAEAAAAAASVGAPACASAPAGASRQGIGAQKSPERSCIVTRAVKPTAELIRFVLSPEGVVTPDIRRALPGRGVWVTGERALIAEACKRKAFARAFRKEVVTPADLADQVGGLLRKDALQALSLANKAGAVTAGFEKVRAALGAAEVLALVEARDGSPDGRRKLGAAAPPEMQGGVGEAPGGRPAIIDCFASADLDLALGRSHVIHAALLKAPAGGFALMKCLRFRRFELIEKHASGGAERRGAPHESRRIEPQDRSLND